MEPVKSKDFKHAIILLKILEDKRIIVIDKETTIRFLDQENFKLLDGFKVNIKHKYYKGSVTAFSSNGENFASLSADCKESRLFSAKTKKLVAKVDRHQGESSCVSIDPLNRYMFSGGEDGKTFAIDIQSGKLIFTLPTHVDTINDISFSPNGNWVATSSYDRKISLFSLVTMTPKIKLKAHAAPVLKSRFLTKNRLLSVDKNSSAIIWNITTSKVIERLNGIHDDIIDITTSKDDKFLFIGTALGYVLVYDLDTYELLSSKYIKLASPITKMAFNEEEHQLILGTEDGFLVYYDIYEGEDKLKTMLQHKEFGNIQKAIDFNPILAYTQIYDLLSNFWENTLKKAKIALEHHNKEKAMLIFNAFKDVPSKNKIIQKTIAEYAEFEKFTTLAKNGKLALAYSLANKHPVYKESKMYAALEKRWKSTFIQAQKYTLDPKLASQAKDLLAPYRGISEKTVLIQELLTKSEVYRRFRTAIGQKDFTICFELIKQHKFLRELPEYDVLTKYADNLYLKVNTLLEKDDTHSAIKLLRVLSVFEDFKDEVKELTRTIEIKQKFYMAIENDDIATAYNLMVQEEELGETKDGKKLQEIWYKDQMAANGFAVNGDALGVKKVLDKYTIVSSKLVAIATIFAWCYMVQLEEKAREGAPQLVIETGIKQYVSSFGLVEQIENFYELFKRKYKDTKLNLELLPKGSLEMWRPAMIVRSILD